MSKNAHTDRYTVIKEFVTPWPHSTYLAHPIHNPEQQVLLKTFRFPDPAENELAYSRTCDLCVLNHPSILPLLDYDSANDEFYLARPFFLSGSLRTLLMLLQSERLMIDECIHILSHVGQALDYAHELGLVHGRISAGNILIDDHGNIFLTDFPPLPYLSLSTVPYTPEAFLFSYIAPEQFSGTTDEKSDQYALACLAYELLTGQLPFGEGDFAAMRAAHCFEEPIPLTEIAPDIPSDLNAIVLRSLSKSPFDRYPDIKSFTNALDEFWSNIEHHQLPSDNTSSPQSSAPLSIDDTYDAETAVSTKKGSKKKKKRPPVDSRPRSQNKEDTFNLHERKKANSAELFSSAIDDDPLLDQLQLDGIDDTSLHNEDHPYANDLFGPLPALPALDLLSDEALPPGLPDIDPTHDNAPLILPSDDELDTSSPAIDHSLNYASSQPLFNRSDPGNAATTHSLEEPTDFPPSDNAFSLHYDEIKRLPDNPFLLFPSENVFSLPPLESNYSQNNTPLTLPTNDTTFTQPEPDRHEKNHISTTFDKSLASISPGTYQTQDNPPTPLPSDNSSTPGPNINPMYNFLSSSTMDTPSYPPPTTAPAANLQQHFNTYSSHPLIIYPPQRPSSSRSRQEKNLALPITITFITIAILLLSGSFFYYAKTSDTAQEKTSSPLSLKATSTPTNTTFIITTSSAPISTTTTLPKNKPTTTTNPRATAPTKTSPTPTPPPAPTPTPASQTASEIYSLATSGKVLATLPTFQAQATETGTIALALDSNLTVGDFAFQADVTTQGDSGGLVFHANSSSDQGDRFRIGTDGSYDLVNIQTSLASGNSSAITQGQNQTNLVTVIEQGQTIYIYVNRKLVVKTTDTITGSTGVIGCMAADFSGSTTASCSNATVYALPSSLVL